VIKNVEKWGCGAINIDVSRIVPSKDYGRSATNSKGTINAHNGFEGKSFKIAERDGEYVSPLGRFPSNLVFTHSENCTDDSCDMFDCPVFMLNEQSGITKSAGGRIGNATGGIAVPKANAIRGDPGFGDIGGASRFFYCAKVSKKERNQGLEGLRKKKNDFQRESSGLSKSNKGRQGEPDNSGQPNENHHPTVKSKKLMSYLINLITPPSGIVLDPFMGSGSTGIAAKECGFNFIGIEKEKEYFEIAQKRIEACQRGPNQSLK
jgi:site-specific DNA-methyltransferase (adenine-specific)